MRIDGLVPMLVHTTVTERHAGRRAFRDDRRRRDDAGVGDRAGQADGLEKRTGGDAAGSLASVLP
ncbi:hypothetical protein [Chromohalobacter japonicus]|uniref:hypothetical protein n=1 Tax=Chromohalobacter japonicus TaxID=223900 RepID=UPI000AF09DCC|nr:hypothetical protein [Chromohalobacter japonicus]